MSLRKGFLAGVAALVLFAGSIAFAAPALAASWHALSMYGDGWGYGVGDSKNEAYNSAMQQCWSANPGENCSSATSVPMSWTLVGIQCGTLSVTAGSRAGYSRAFDIAVNTANGYGYGYYDCVAIVSR